MRAPRWSSFVRLLAGAAMFAVNVGAAPLPPASPNVILILADDMGLGDLSCFNGGLSRTPNLDRLVGEGVWFNQGYSASAVCAPARAALLTGRYPHRTGVVSLTMTTEPELTRLRRDEITVADLFLARGYATGLVGKWHLGMGAEWHPRRRGFQEFTGFIGGENIESYFGYDLDVQGKNTRFESRYLTDELSARAIDFVRRHRAAPFFLHLAHYAPHRPIGAPPETIQRYLDRGISRDVATVYAMIENMDRGIGELLAEVRELGLRERTIVVFASDNGPDPLAGPRFNHQRRGTKYEIYEGGIRVPLLVSWPGVFRSRTTDVVAHFTDIVPTLIELCRLERPAGPPLDGASLAGLLHERDAGPRRPRFWQWNRGVPNYTHNAAMREGEWKLVRPYVTRNAVAGDSALGPALYNLQIDPLETTDVAGQHPERLARMNTALAEWARGVERDRVRPAPR